MTGELFLKRWNFQKFLCRSRCRNSVGGSWRTKASCGRWCSATRATRASTCQRGCWCRTKSRRRWYRGCWCGRGRGFSCIGSRSRCTESERAPSGRSRASGLPGSRSRSRTSPGDSLWFPIRFTLWSSRSRSEGKRSGRSSRCWRSGSLWRCTGFAGTCTCTERKTSTSSRCGFWCSCSGWRW